MAGYIRILRIISLPGGRHIAKAERSPAGRQYVDGSADRSARRSSAAEYRDSPGRQHDRPRNLPPMAHVEWQAQSFFDISVFRRPIDGAQREMNPHRGGTKRPPQFFPRLHRWGSNRRIERHSLSLVSGSAQMGLRACRNRVPLGSKGCRTELVASPRSSVALRSPFVPTAPIFARVTGAPDPCSAFESAR